MMKKRIGILGSGEVGTALTRGFLLDAYDVMVGSRSGQKAAHLDEALQTDIKTGTFREVAAWGEIVILAVKGSAAEGVAGDIANVVERKILIDVTNPVSDNPPKDGLLTLFTSPNESLAERIQNAAPEARVVKAWNTVGHRYMIDPDFSAIPTMPICGNDARARKEVAELLVSFGWEVEDLGRITSARAIEQLVVFLCLPGFLHGDWNHALKLLRA